MPRDEAVHREPPEVCVAEPGEVRRSDASAAIGTVHGEPFVIQDLYDFGG
jgi:hypothetical protein